MSSGNAALNWIVELSANIPGWRAGDAAKVAAEAAYKSVSSWGAPCF